MKCIANILLQLICDAQSQKKPNNLVLTQSHAMANHHKSTTTESASRMFTDQSNILYLAGKQYSLEMRGSYHTMGVWQFTFIGFNMTHCLLAKTEHQQEIDSKNKDQAPSAFPHILYILPWYWHSRRGIVHKEPVRTLPQSVKRKKAQLCISWTPRSSRMISLTYSQKGFW